MDGANQLRHLIQKVSAGTTLAEEEIRLALELMTAGEATPAQMGAFLMALRVRGETVEEITGAAQMLRSRMNRVAVPDDAVDIVGTGGDSHGTYNVSTCAALIAAGAGIKVAKHGNRRVSSMSGASDVLSVLGVKLEVPAEVISRCVSEAGVGFMWAPMHHPAMKHWAPVRGELGIRTIFNLLGPICNPAGVQRQVVGVFSWQWVEPIAHVLNKLGCRARLGGARPRRPRRADHHGRDRRRRGQGRQGHRVRGDARRRRPGAGQAVRPQGRRREASTRRPSATCWPARRRRCATSPSSTPPPP